MCDIQFKIMEDKGHWVFENKTITRIKAFDVEAISKFYYDNLSSIKAICGRFCYVKRVLDGLYNYEFTDCVQQVFLDLPYYNFSSRSNLYHSIINSCRYVNNGGITCYKAYKNEVLLNLRSAKSLDALLKDEADSDNLYNFIPSYDVFDKEEQEEIREILDSKLCSFLEEHIKDKDELNRIWCYCFTTLRGEEIKGNEYEHYKRLAKVA